QFASVTLNAFKADTELQAGAHITNFPTAAVNELRIDARAEHPFAPLDLFLNEFAGRALIHVDSPARREVLQEMLRGHGYNIVPLPSWDDVAKGDAKLAMTVAPGLQRLTLTSPRIAVISEAQLSGQRARQERRRKR